MPTSYDSLIDSIIAQKYNAMTGAIDTVYQRLSNDLKNIVRDTPATKQRKAANRLLKRYSKDIPTASLKALSETQNRYFDIVDLQRKTFNDLGYLLPPMNLDANTLSAVFDVQSVEMEYVGGQSQILTSTAKRIITGQILGQDLSKKESVKLISKAINKLSNRAKADADTMLTTSINMIGRGVSERIATVAGVEWYKPTGPLDRKTRPFDYALLRGKDPNSNGERMPYDQKDPNFSSWLAGCRPLKTLQGGYIHITEINSLDNGQMPNVLITFGGYRCRHEWQAATALKNEELIDDNPKLHEKYKGGSQ